MTLFWRQGYHATSLKDLEATLSMKPGSIYAAFHSKEALFRATLDRYGARMTSELQALVEQSPSPLEALRDHLIGLADLSPCDRPSTACMLVKSLLEVSREGELRMVIEEHLDRVESVIAEAFEAAQRKGELRPDCDPVRLARRMQTYIFGLKVQAQRETDPDAMRALCRDLADEIGQFSTRPV